jgi:hypothetical protein
VNRRAFFKSLLGLGAAGAVMVVSKALPTDPLEGKEVHIHGDHTQIRGSQMATLSVYGDNTNITECLIKAEPNRGLLETKNVPTLINLQGEPNTMKVTNNTFDLSPKDASPYAVGYWGSKRRWEAYLAVEQAKRERNRLVV